MKIKRLLGLMIVFYACSLNAGIWNKFMHFVWGGDDIKPSNPSIRVLIVRNQPGVSLAVQGKYSIYDPKTQKYLTASTKGNKKYLQTLPTGLKWGEEFPGIYQLHIVPESELCSTFINGVEYRGSFYVYDVEGRISIVNEVDIEEFLASSLSLKFEQPLPKETLSSIAISARTNAYWWSLHPRNQYWAIDAEKEGYEGHVSRYGSQIEKAVYSTRYMILTRTGSYEKKLTPFPAKWGITSDEPASSEESVFAKISLYEAEDFGKRGEDAAKILAKAFPQTHIELVSIDEIIKHS